VGRIGVLAALRARDETGRGQFIDLGLYESVFRLLDEIAPAYAKYGIVRKRMGADTVNVVPHSHYRTATGEWVALACTNDKMFARLAAVMGLPELAQQYPTSAVRVQNRDYINSLVAEWMAKHSLEEAIKITREGGVPCAQIYSIREIFQDPQYQARGNLLRVQDSRVGELVVPAPVPRLSETPPTFRHTGRPLGADNEEVYSNLLGLTREDLHAASSAGRSPQMSTQGIEQYRMFINGEWVDAADGARFETTDPYTGRVWATLRRATKTDADRAVEAAAKAPVMNRS
jgi:crotonobetainyl-CoA:carnitine CoA-transferase CaiB-like acyl-CoA transferase